MVHSVPFQCIVRGLFSPLPAVEKPTAHTSSADTTAIPRSALPIPPLGLGTPRHPGPQGAVGEGEAAGVGVVGVNCATCVTTGGGTKWVPVALGRRVEVGGSGDVEVAAGSSVGDGVEVGGVPVTVGVGAPTAVPIRRNTWSSASSEMK